MAPARLGEWSGRGAPKRAEPSMRSELDLLEIQIETLFQLDREGRFLADC